MACILGLDIGINRTGWCVGDGSATPTADAWRFDQLDIRPEDLGALGWQLWTHLKRLRAAHAFTHVIYEAPLIDRYRDKVLNLRRRFGMDMMVEAFCTAHNVACEEEPFGPIKKELAGWSGADKDDMVYAAEKLGVRLPVTKAAGREDAADAVGAWLIGVRHHAKAHAASWDRILYSPRSLARR